jgi:hypothetical protein
LTGVWYGAASSASFLRVEDRADFPSLAEMHGRVASSFMILKRQDAKSAK